MQYSSFKINKKRALYKINKTYHIKFLTFICILLVILLLISKLYSKNIIFKYNYKYYISEKGNDGNNGSKDYPFQSLQGFKNLLIKDINDNKITKGSIKVYIDNGTYNFSEGFKLTNKDLLDKNISISFIGKNKDKVFLTGGITLDNKKLKAVNNNIFNLF